MSLSFHSLPKIFGEYPKLNSEFKHLARIISYRLSLFIGRKGEEISKVREKKRTRVTGRNLLSVEFNSHCQKLARQHISLWAHL
jgi:hypothetical protein